MEATPGFIRIRGIGSPLLAGTDIHVEAQQGDGTWLPLRGVCTAKVTIGPDAFVTANIEIEVGALELSGVIPDAIEWRDSRSFWQRLSSRVRNVFSGSAIMEA